MFTGIVRERGRVVSFDGGRLVVAAATDAAIGDSVSISGVCLTVVERGGGTLAFDVVGALDPNAKAAGGVERLRAAGIDVDAGRTQSGDAARRLRIRVEGADDDACDAGSRDRVGARRRASVMRARLQRDEHLGAVCTVAGRAQRDGLRVVDGVVLVPPLAHHLAAGDDDRADERMVAHLPSAALGELESPLHVVHASACTRRR